MFLTFTAIDDVERSCDLAHNNLLFAPLFLVALKDIPYGIKRKAAANGKVLKSHQLYAKAKNSEAKPR